jgi:hypothetical protein
MGPFLQDIKFRISCTGRESNSHNIMQGHPLPTMCALKKLDPHRIQSLDTNAIWDTKD